MKREAPMRLLNFFLILLFAPLIAEESPPPAATQTEIKQKAPERVVTEEKAPQIHQNTESYESAFIKTIIVLVGLLVLVILTIWMFKKISNGRLRTFNTLKSIKILEKRPLSPKSMLYLIEVSGKQVLIAESQLEVRPVTTLDWMGTDKDL